MIENPRLNGAITSEDILGKDVIDVTGAFLGVTDTIYMHPKTMKVIAISVDKGFLRKGFLIGAGYVKEITDHAVFLTIEPAFQLKGMTVFDSNGAKVGKVQAVNLVGDANTIKEIVVKSGVGGNTMTVPAQYLDRIENNVLLNVAADKLPAQK